MSCQFPTLDGAPGAGLLCAQWTDEVQKNTAKRLRGRYGKYGVQHLGLAATAARRLSRTSAAALCGREGRVLRSYPFLDDPGWLTRRLSAFLAAHRGHGHAAAARARGEV